MTWFTRGLYNFSVNKSQLEMNVEKKVVNIQPIYEPLKKQKKKKKNSEKIIKMESSKVSREDG